MTYSEFKKQAARPVNIYKGPKLLPGDPEIVDAVRATTTPGFYLRAWFEGKPKAYLDARDAALKKYPGSTIDDFNSLYRKYIDNYNNKAIEVPQGGKPKAPPKK